MTNYEKGIQMYNQTKKAFETNNKKEAVNVRTLDEQFTLQTGIDVSKKERGINLKPVVGMGVTRSIGSDSYPFTILDIRNVKGKTILVIQRDKDLYNKDVDASVKYLEEYRNHGLNGRIEYKDIKWNKQTKRWNKGQSFYFASIGQRTYYRDPSV